MWGSPPGWAGLAGSPVAQGLDRLSLPGASCVPLRLPAALAVVACARVHVHSCPAFARL